MGLFKKKVEEEIEDEEDILDKEDLKRPKRIKDLKPQNRKARKEPPKPWGKKERYTVLITFLFTVITAGVLSASARAWKLPNMPRIKMPNLSEFFLFKEQTVVVGQTGDGTDQEKINSIKLNFREKTESYSGIYAFYIYDLEGDYFYGENYQESMQAASLIKLPVMALALSKIEDGTLKSEGNIELIKAMGKRSDNAAYLKMVENLGRGEIQKYINEIGMSGTSLEENLTTPADVGLFFKKLYKKDLLGDKNTKELLSFLTDTIYEDWITGGIPQGIRVSHKYGREIHCVNDAGIIFSDRPFIMVLMTDGVIESEADELFPTLSKLLYDGHTKSVVSN